MPTAFISVFDKKGVARLADALGEKGWHIIATEGTAAHIHEHSGVRCARVEWYTDAQPIFGGRVKTLHPKIVGGILAREKDILEAKQRRIPLIDLVVVNLYPFGKAVANGAPDEECLEMIDIGGHALLRAAAKNFKRVCVASDYYDYDLIISALKHTNTISLALRKELAAKAFECIVQYDTNIAGWFDTA
ncbi:MAG: IMP cyclohydrolase [Parcubacteria group bacterium]|nr:IMP cyclohydrolase [Parcubacteria group bacterium]